MIEIVIFSISILFFSLGINKFPLRNWDEAWYAQVIKDMVSGKYGYLMPHWNGEYFFDKPPLYFWLNLPVVEIFGLGEWQLRLVSVILTSFSSLLIYKISQKLVSNWIALTSSLVFLILGQVKERLSAGNLDGLLVFLILLSIYLAQKATKSNRFIIPFMISWGLIALAKSWLYFLIFPLFSFPFVDLKFYFQNLRYLPVAITIAFSWYLLGAISFGKPFINWYLLYNGAFGVPRIYPELFITLFRDNIGIFPLIFFSKKILFVCLSYIFLLMFYQESFGWYLLPIYPLLAIAFGIALKNLHKWQKLIILVTFLSQTFIFISLTKVPDNSLESASAGIFIRDHFQDSDKIFFNGNDFPGVLYYSGKDQINLVKGD